jgi:hypothetical protein
MIRLRLSTERWSVVSALIRWRCDSKSSHIEYECDDGWTLGARFSLRGKIARVFGYPKCWLKLDGVQLRPPSANRKQTSIRYFTFDSIEQAYHWEFDNRLDTPYDLMGILGIVTARGWAKSGDAFCSEVKQEGAIAVGAGGGKGFQNCAPQACTPRDIEISLIVKEIT